MCTPHLAAKMSEKRAFWPPCPVRPPGGPVACHAPLSSPMCPCTYAPRLPWPVHGGSADAHFGGVDLSLTVVLQIVPWCGNVAEDTVMAVLERIL